MTASPALVTKGGKAGACMLCQGRDWNLIRPHRDPPKGPWSLGMAKAPLKTSTDN
jgi:hypothetical protein